MTVIETREFIKENAVQTQMRREIVDRKNSFGGGVDNIGVGNDHETQKSTTAATP